MVGSVVPRRRRAPEGPPKRTRGFSVVHKKQPSVTASRGRSRRRQPALPGGRLGAPLGLILLVALAFGNAPPEELSYDSRAFILENPLFVPGTSWWTPFVTNYWGEVGYSGLYRPLSLSLLRLENGPLGFGQDPLGYAAVNIGLHVLASFLVFQLGRRWLSHQWAGLAAAALFAVHPLASAVVPTAVGQLDLLATVFVLASLVAWEKHRETGSWRWVFGAAFLWLLGLMSKESAVVVPGLIAVRELSRIGGAGGGEDEVPNRTSWSSWLPFLVAGSVWFAARHLVLREQGERFILALNNPLVLESLATRWLTGSRVLVEYLGQALLPLRLSADYSFDQVSIVSADFSPALVGTAAASIGVLILAAVLWRKWRPAAVGMAFFFLALLPVSNLFFLVGSIRADRFLYLSLFGVCLFAGEILGRLSALFVERTPKWARPRAALAFAGAVVLALGIVKTRRENAAWRTNLSVWEHAVLTAPDSLKAHYNLAFFLNKDSPGSSERALGHLERAVAIESRLPGDDFNAAHLNLGKAYLARAVATAGPQGDLGAEGIGWLNESLEVLQEAERREAFPGRRRAWWERLNAGEVARDRRLVAGREQFGEEELHTTLATVLDLLGRSEEAVERVERAIAIDPEAGEHRYRLAILHVAAGRFGPAEEALVAATTLAPENEDAWFRLAALRLNRGAYLEAVNALSNGGRHHPGVLEFEETLLKVYPAAVEILRGSGREAEAEELTRLAVDRDGLPRSVFERVGAEGGA